MKKMLMIMLATVAVLTGCEKTDSTNIELVKSVEMPPLTEQFYPGSPVTIKGSRFAQTDAISFRSATKSGDINATIIEVSALKITFTVPSGLIVGEYSVILKRDGAEQVLGKLAIAEPKSVLGVWELTKCEVFLYGVLFEETLVDAGEVKMEFKEDGTLIYWDYVPSEAHYFMQYEYKPAEKKIILLDETNPIVNERVMEMIVDVTEISLKWSYPEDEGGYMTVEYYKRK